jgi:hypothetical protein
MQMSQSVSSTRASKAPLTNVGGKSEVIKTRTGYSFRKAVGHIPEVVRALKAAGHDYAPIVDRASTFGYAKWVSEAAKQGLPHVFGVELAVSKLINAKKPSSDQWAFLALDDLSGINRLINTATQQFRYQPLLTVEQAISAPGVFKITGPAPPFELSDGPIEGVHIPLAPSTPMGVIKRAVRHGWPLIATHDSFYPTPEDRSFYEILCGRGADLQMHAQHILSEAEWRESVEPFGLSPAQLEDALALARRALERSAGIPLPKASLPHPERKATLREMCLHGAEERGLKVLGDEVYEARLNRELALIEEKDYTDYFYIVSDLCKWAKKNMVVGPARGSSCGSLVCYLLDITDIDPIPYGLIFERFIDVNRDDMPDIDIDFSDKNRHMVFDYLCERYGHDHVARLGTVAMYQPKSSLSEVGTALKIPKWMCDAVADSMLERSGGDARALFKIEDTLATMPAGQRLVQEYPEVAIVTKFEGHPRHNSTHAAGIVVADKPIYEYVAVDERTGSTMCDKKDAEGAFNLLKIDCLGLTQLSVFEDCLELAGKKYDYLLKIPMDDEEAFKVLNEGRWAGVFQFNGIALQSITKQFKVDSFNDIVCVTALARPGPLASGGAHEWVKRRNGSSPIAYPHPIFEPYMNDTLGVVLYQEQVMEIGRNVGDLNWGQVTQLRKAMSKSLGAEYFDQFGDPWKKGAISKGVDPKATVKIWDDLCLSGDTVLENPFPSKGLYAKMTLKELYVKGGMQSWQTKKRQSLLMWDGQSLKPSVNHGVTYSGVKQTYTLKTELGNEIHATEEHKFLQEDGSYVALKDLEVGGHVMADGGKIPSERKRVKGVGRGGQNWWHKLASGEPILKRNIEFLRRTTKNCQHCHDAPYEETHHINMDHEDHRIENLLPVCRKCHKKLHAQVSGYAVPWQSGRCIIKDTIVSINPRKMEDVYDVHMPSPHHNFLANSIVVHNCAYGSWSFNKCFSTRTIVHLAEAGNGFKKEMTIGELYERYEVDPSRWIKQKKRKPILWSLDESGNAVKQMCKRIICNGERDIYKYTFADGSFVECTKEHKFIIDGEWGSIGSASIGSLFTQIEKDGVPWIKTHKVLSSIEYIGKEVTYDIEMPTHHNFKLANGLITHNSHSVAYGLLSYWCCYLKARFPLEFAAATLTHESDPDRQLKLLRELVAEGYSYLPVCAETSTEKWSVARKGVKATSSGH